MSSQSQYKKIDGVHFLKTVGTFSEQAEQHGRILKETIHQGALHALAKKK